jgi:hypothetical protein
LIWSPSVYYRNKDFTLNEIRVLEGVPPEQGGLFAKNLVLGDERWKYRVVWSLNTGRIGARFEVTPKTFKGWAEPDPKQEWWKRVERGELVYHDTLYFWHDRVSDEGIITAEDRQCGMCGEWDIPDAGVRFPASALRAFLGGR